jgi:hypothetical protein
LQRRRKLQSIVAQLIHGIKLAAAATMAGGGGGGEGGGGGGGGGGGDTSGGGYGSSNTAPTITNTSMNVSVQENQT